MNGDNQVQVMNMNADAMRTKNILFTAEPLFLHRHKPLITSLSAYCDFSTLSIGGVYNQPTINKMMKLFYCFRHRIKPDYADGFFKNAGTFIQRSQQLERKINSLKNKPDLVFHFFSLCCPSWDSNIPYVMYLDYTMALANRYYPTWVPFNNGQDLDSWLNCERLAYKRASHVFTMSSVVKNSLIKDYNINPEKVTVIGASGNFEEPYSGEKILGTKQILFNGSDFERKGGNLVLSAFEKIKKTIPNAKLVIIGKKIDISMDGVENPGAITSSSELENLFGQTDLVLAPASCEPFGVFIVEAMNYGVPCIVTANDANGIADFLEHEIDSIIIRNPTPEILAQHTINIMRNPFLLASMSQAARSKVRTKLNWNYIAKQIISVLYD